MDDEVPPEYRIRLFLSVDLVGSTAYKSKEGSTNLKWIKAFQKFYGEFPYQFKRNYKQLCSSIPEIPVEEYSVDPKVWKTIGDEILFVNRVNSITHLGAYVKAFAQTLIDFGREVHTSYELNTKGNAWIAAFPNPNRSIRLSMNGDDPLIGENEVLTEAFEAKVDDTPSNYDFLGKGIDGGFRISRNSTIDTFTISPALAYLLCKAKRNVDTTKFDGRFVFHEPQEFKGVVKGQKYPVISLITSRDEAFDYLQSLESELLDRPREADFVKLFTYLESYIVHHGIERPELRLTANGASVDPPEHYSDYIKEWREDLEKIRAAKSYEDSASSANGEADESSALNPQTKAVNLEAAIKDFLRLAESVPAKNDRKTVEE
ncbi:hypothetical protein [Agrobacterium larrymoorei]|uniref:Uncharacterized protein n=1 Tax=Agrobacterium larrymoorei TaxID=160699 RepID=A0A4D7DKV5_9HYPH|nr:hypothetical protein [Agrobacterium larrymoorei]QCI96527.1 hypothetical protein CFBP5473_00460 [Agrobacterium larrymoorei]QYA08052.1 hypothetical protein J5285_04925 [Agrobacterium larrymoorei]WHA41159.1 hypothetical protein CFBP5477_000465 [Agrobacterium larrymoorei]